MDSILPENATTKHEGDSHVVLSQYVETTFQKG